MKNNFTKAFCGLLVLCLIMIPCFVVLLPKKSDNNDGAVKVDTQGNYISAEATAFTEVVNQAKAADTLDFKGYQASGKLSAGSQSFSFYANGAYDENNITANLVVNSNALKMYYFLNNRDMYFKLNNMLNVKISIPETSIGESDLYGQALDLIKSLPSMSAMIDANIQINDTTITCATEGETMKFHVSSSTETYCDSYFIFENNILQSAKISVTYKTVLLDYSIEQYNPTQIQTPDWTIESQPAY